MNHPSLDLQKTILNLTQIPFFFWITHVWKLVDTAAMASAGQSPLETAPSPPKWLAPLQQYRATASGSPLKQAEHWPPCPLQAPQHMVVGSSIHSNEPEGSRKLKIFQIKLILTWTIFYVITVTIRCLFWGNISSWFQVKFTTDCLLLITRCLVACESECSDRKLDIFTK